MPARLYQEPQPKSFACMARSCKNKKAAKIAAFLFPG